MNYIFDRALMFLLQKTAACSESNQNREIQYPKKYRNQPGTNSSSHRLPAEVPQSSQKLSMYIKDLNERGLKSIRFDQLPQAQEYFLQCERLLEMGASLGKSIDRELILTVLVNQAFVHQRIGKLESAKRYLEAVIFNLTQFVEHPTQTTLLKELCKFADRRQTTQRSYFLEAKECSLRGLFYRIYQLSSAELEYAKLLAETGEHESAIQKAKKSVRTMIGLCKYCRIYHILQMKDERRYEINLLQFLIKFQQDFCSESYIYLKKQINAFLKNERKRIQPFDVAIFNRLKVQDFLLLKPKKYRDVKNQDNSFVQIQQFEQVTSGTNHIRKALMIVCGYFLVGVEIMQKIGETHQQNKGKLFVLGSEMILQKQRQQKVKEVQLHYLFSICLTLNYLHESAVIPSQLLQKYKLVQQQQPRSSIVSDVKTEDIQNEFNVLTCKYAQFMLNHSRSINKICINSGIQCDGDREETKRYNLIMPPSNDQFLFELPSTDSISINSNSSMIDVLKSAENAVQSTRTDLDNEPYFSKPKLKQQQKNPLFSGTLNLLTFQQEIKLSAQSSHKKKRIQIKKQEIQHITTRYKKQNINCGKVQSLEKNNFYSESVKKKKNDTLNHNISTGRLKQVTAVKNITVCSNKNKNKHSKGKKNITIGSSNKINLNQNMKNTVYTAKQSTSFHFKFNKVKSPSSKYQSGRLQLVQDSNKLVKKSSKSKSRQHSLSKSKSLSNKLSLNRNLKLRFQPVYFNNKK